MDIGPAQGCCEWGAGIGTKCAIFKSFRERSVLGAFYIIYISIYFDAYIFNKNMQNVEFVAENMKRWIKTYKINHLVVINYKF